MKNNQKGFAHLAIALIIVLIAAVAGGGYWVYQRNHKSKVTNFADCQKANNTTGIMDAAYHPTCTYQGKTYNNPTPSTPPVATSSSTTAPKVSYVHVTQWGVKVPIVSGASNITYTITASDQANEGIISFRSTELNAASTIKDCNSNSRVVMRGIGTVKYSPEGIIDSTTLTYAQAFSQTSDTSGPMSLHLHIGNYYYLHGHPGASCVEESGTTPATTKEANAITALESAIKQMVAE